MDYSLKQIKAYGICRKYIEDYIDESGADWNFDQHKIIDTKANLDDFKNVVSDYLSWGKVSKILKKDSGTCLGN